MCGMPKQSAGLLVYRLRPELLEVFLVHPGGPYWSRKDDGAWSIPKGEIGLDEQPISAARREFQEETGFPIDGPFVALGSIRQSGGKTVQAFGVRGELDPAKVVSNVFSMEWPPRSGKQVEFPEIDRAAWFSIERAKLKMNPAQCEFLERLEKLTSGQKGAGNRSAP